MVIMKMIKILKNIIKRFQNYIEYKGRFLDGEKTNYYTIKIKESKTTFKRGAPDGKFISYYDDENIEEEGYYKNGKKDGKWLTYYEGWDGKIYWGGDLDKDLEDTPAIKKEEYYKDDKFIKSKEYTKNQVLKYEIKENTNSYYYNSKGKIIHQIILNSDDFNIPKEKLLDKHDEAKASYYKEEMWFDEEGNIEKNIVFICYIILREMGLCRRKSKLGLDILKMERFHMNTIEIQVIW